MQFFGILFLIVFLFAAYPYVRFFVKRVICFVKLRSACKRKNFTLRGTHFLWFMGLNRADKCDLYIETQEKIFSVKLFGAITKTSEFVFDKDGTYRVNEPLLRGMVHYSFKRKKIPRYDFRYKYKEDWEIKTQENIALINPVPLDISQITDNRKQPLTVLGGGAVFSLRTFLARLENAR